MHPYVTDSEERKIIPWFLAVLGVLASWALYAILNSVQVSPPWWIDMPSLIGFYGLFYTVFDKWLWQVPVFHAVGLVKVPNLNGTWEGEISSSYHEHQNKLPATIQIVQTWSKIVINLETESSKSRSQTASVITETPDTILVTYEYLNEPKPHSTSTMHAHRGTARHTLALVDGDVTFNGEYYSGRDRGNFGTLYFTKGSV
jgi:hypothetical protein